GHCAYNGSGRRTANGLNQAVYIQGGNGGPDRPATRGDGSYGGAIPKGRDQGAIQGLGFRPSLLIL
ncbi:hypothetical protein ACP7G3_003139, partial [Escherichia coli]